MLQQLQKKQRIKNYQKLIGLKIFRWEFAKTTPKRHKKWMNTIADNLRANLNEIQLLRIDRNKFYEAIRKRKSWSASGIDGIQY